MKRLKILALTPPYLDRFTSIRDSKHLVSRNALAAIHALVTKRYADLWSAVSARKLQDMKSSTAAVANSKVLRGCYGNSTKPLVKLKEDIAAAQAPRLLKYCPMCWTTLPGGFDHYMPGVKFPEFSVHPLNLIPCCSTCNSTKDDDWLSTAGTRQFIHAYLDTIPNVQFLGVTLVTQPPATAVGATFNLVQPTKPDSRWPLIASHFKRLDLINRYNDLANDEIEEMLGSCASHLRAGGLVAADFLTMQADDTAKIFGRNNWRAVLMNALANHADLQAWALARR